MIEPIFEERFIHDSYACRPGKGTHKALDRFTRYARRYAFVLKADIRQYFPSIDHEVLLGIVARRLADKRLMSLIGLILGSGQDVLKQEYDLVCYPGDDLFAALRPRGLPIGNLTSQFMANIYLDPLDHFVKEALREKAYIRYCDDFVVFGEDREHLLVVREKIRHFLCRLRLTLHERKSVVYRTRDGVPFLGFLVFPTHRRLLRKSVVRAARRLRELAELYADGLVSASEVRQRVMAWLGHARHGDTWGLRRQLLGSTSFLRSNRNAPGHADLREDVRLESVAVPEDHGLPQAAPAYVDASPGVGHA